jgi:hypothetical protein
VKFRLFFLLIYLSASSFAQNNQTLTVEQSVVLDNFFRVLSEESEAGYVFFGKKPVCIHGFFCRDPFIVGSPIHKQAITLKEGARIWKHLPVKNSDVIIHICDKEEPNIPGYFHVLVINVPLFHRVVNENISLFQYVLGPETTSNGLLNALISNDQPFHSLLKDDKVLIGALLGFDLSNALYVSRIENIYEAIEKDNPPFVNSERLIQENNQEYLPFKPTFGFKSVKEELDNFQGKITLSSEKLRTQNPEFIFGWLKDSKKTEKFISELEETQNKIQALLSSSTFLEEVLEKFTGKKYFLCTDNRFQFLLEKKDVNRAVAKGLWMAVQDYDFEYLPYFIEGLKRAEPQNLKTDRLAWFPRYRRDFLEGKENLERADIFFQSLAKDEDFHSILPGNLYYKTLKAVNGDMAGNNSLISLNCTVFSPLGHCLAHHDKILLNLNNTISGFAHGIKGMKTGETRELFIHPCLAYGFDTSLEKCIYLRVIVTLLTISGNSENVQNPFCIDLSFLKDPATLTRRNENYKIALIEKSSKIANYLKKCKEIDLIVIADYLNQFYTNTSSAQPPNQAEQELINQVHWNIYWP